MYWDIESPARSVHGAPYGLFMEVGTKPHRITRTAVAAA
jgi:hypothetical protein